YVGKNMQALVRQGEQNKYVRDNLLPYATDTAVFIREVKNNADKKNVIKTYPALISRLESMDELQIQKEETGISCLDYLHAFAIQEITKGFRIHKTLANQLSFDDLI